MDFCVNTLVPPSFFLDQDFLILANLNFLKTIAMFNRFDKSGKTGQWDKLSHGLMMMDE
jgi:hypothetical protein